MKSKLLSILLVSLIAIIPFRLVSQTNCLPPTGLTTTNITLTGATLSWTAPTGALNYVVQYHTVTSPASAWINLATQNTSLTLSNLLCGTQYEWQVAAYCGTAVGSVSSYSSPLSFTTLACVVPCPPPTGLSTTNITLTGATFSWMAPAGVLSYVVQYRPLTTPVSAWISVNATATSVTISNLICSTQYEWQVAANCSNTPGSIISYSTPISFTTLACTPPCAATTGLITSNITQTGVTLSWTAVTSVYNYLIQYRPLTTPASTWTSMSSQTTSLTLTSLTCGIQYEWQVATYCGNGVMSTYTAGTSFSTLACSVPCLPPTGLITTNITLTGATLLWIAPGSALGYVAQYRPVTTPASTWINVTSQLTSVTLTSLTCGTQYEWQVATYCGSGVMSTYTAGTSFSTLACSVPCLAPTGLITSNITQTGVTLSWTAVTSVYNYLIQYRPLTTSASTWTITSSQTTSLTLTSLTCGIQYEWQVATYCGNGVMSTYTAGTSFSTLACSVPCLQPTGLITSNITLTGATLSWTANSGALTYVVHYRPVTTPVSTWISISTQNTTVPLSGLTCGTQYEWQVANYCSTTPGGFSSYSPSVTFTTLSCTIPCLPPAGLTTTNITLTGASLSWIAPGSALGYVVQYRPVTTPASTWINVTSQLTSLTLTSLTCGTQYEWQVATYCGNGVMSTYAAGTSFSTIACSVPCLPSTGLITSNITLTGATLSWAANSGALTYVVHYRPVTTPVSTWISISTQNTSVTLSGLTCGTQYEWQVANYCSTAVGGFSPYSPSVTFTTLACTIPCLPPAGLTTTNITLTGATFSWIAPGSALGYMVQYRPMTIPASAWINVTASITSVTISSLSCGTQYEWQVASYCSNAGSILSAYSTPINFTTLACSIPCVVPTGLITSNITQTGVTLSWTAATGVYTYLIQYRPVTTPASTWTSTSLQTTSLTLTSLTCGIQYEWQVATYCGNGVMSTYTAGTSFSTLACSVPCLPPTGLITSNIILTGATLSWTANSGALTYVVHYRPVTTPVSAWISVNATTTSVTISNLICGTQYEWQVGAICSNTPGSIISYSTPISFSTLACVVACLPPTGLTTSTITLTGATLSWIAPGSALGYVVQYRPGTTPASTWINVTSQLTSVTLTSLTCGTQYEWQVATYCGNGVMSTYTAGTSFSTLACAVPCLPPIGLTTTNITLTGATLSWTANSGALTYVVHYRPVTTPVSTWSSISTQNTTIPLSGLNCGTQYEWQVANYCSTAVGGFSSYSPSVTFTTLACVVTCLPPAGLTTTNITLTGATLSWIAPGSALGYVVQYRPVTTPASAWINVTATTTSVTLSSLSCGTQYEWEVAIYCSNVTNVLSAYSTPISFTTLACAVPCNPPTGLTTTNITLTGATLSWTANSGAITYVVHYRPVTTPVSTWSSVSTQNTTVPLSGLTCGTQYEWQVANYCSTTPGGFSSYSPLVTFTTLACTVPCLPPAGLTTTNITLTGATLSWIVPSGVLAYVVHYRPVTTPTSAWITVAATTNTVILSNLNCGTTYEWQVASYCSNVGSALSVYSTPISFSTLTCTLNNCAVPSGLTSIFPNTIPSNLMLQWNSTNANSYNIRYKKVSTSAYIMTTSATNSKLLTGLTNGQYEWQVQSICASNTGLALVSPWSVTAWFSISGNPVIFPNPVLNKEIHLSLVIEAETTMIILITDQFGNTVKLLNKTVTPNTETLDIDVSDLKNGIYFIQINGDNINEFQKIVVMR